MATQPSVDFSVVDESLQIVGEVAHAVVSTLNRLFQAFQVRLGD